MLTLTDVVTLPLSAADVAVARRHTTHSSFGGRSAVRPERGDTCVADNLVGHLGQIALHWYLYGSLERYELGRWLQNQFPTTGDGGSDVPGLRLDVKTSLMRTQQPLLRHRLLVRPAERHPDTVYVLALVTKVEQLPLVHLVGWARDSMLPAEPAPTGVFQGAYVLPATELHPLMPLNYAWITCANP